MILDVRKGIKALLCRQFPSEIADAQNIGQLLCLGGFVKLLLTESYGECVFRHQGRRDVAGIHAAGKECTQGHVADPMSGHGFTDRRIDGICHILKGGSGFLGEIHVPIAADMHFAIRKGKGVGGRQFIRSAEEGLLRCRILEGQIGAEGIGIHRTAEAGMLEKALDLRAEEEVSVLHHGIVKRLDAEIVSRTEQGALSLIPDNKSKHTPQHGNDPLTEFLIAVDNDLRVAPGTEHVSTGDQIVTEGGKVIDLPVEHNYHGVIFIIHRLGTVRQIDDAEATEA